MWFYNAVRERGPYSQAWQNNSTQPLLHVQALLQSDSYHLRESSLLKHDTNNVVHKPCQLHLLNLTASHIFAPSLPNSSHYILVCQRGWSLWMPHWTPPLVYLICFLRNTPRDSSSNSSSSCQSISFFLISRGYFPWRWHYHVCVCDNGC